MKVRAAAFVWASVTARLSLMPDKGRASMPCVNTPSRRAASSSPSSPSSSENMTVNREGSTKSHPRHDDSQRPILRDKEPKWRLQHGEARPSPTPHPPLVSMGLSGDPGFTSHPPSFSIRHIFGHPRLATSLATAALPCRSPLPGQHA